MKVFKEIKDFAVKGSVVDLSVGVMLGGAFGKVIDSLVSDMLMPPLGLMMAKVDFSNLYINLSGGSYRSLQEAKEAGAITVNYGLFLNTLLHFGIISISTFYMIRQLNRFRNSPLQTLSDKDCPFCFTRIPEQAKRCPHCTSDLTKPNPPLKVQSNGIKVNIMPEQKN
ncbi:MAG: large conductance mechanosensitive channel protein MscL [Bacillaceae bacterium]|nr:large conductance mechanosensitive channel protein MscL [Bacillaceae bacterium]